MGAKSKRKGAKGELEVARIMSAWWCGEPEHLDRSANDLPIRRTPLSGGWAKGKGLSSDLVVIDDRYKDFTCLSVEVKNQEKWDFDQLFKANQGWAVHTWWSQCCESASAENAVPWLVFTKNRCPWFFRMYINHFKKICRDVHIFKRLIRFDGSVYGLLDLFTDNIKPDSIVGAFKNGENKT